LGYRAEVVLSGSMRPHLQPGDMVVVHRIGAEAIRVGQVVSFKSPQGGFTITHRVRSLHAAPGGRIAVETRGDANNTSEHWTIARSGSVGKVVATVPQVGRLTLWAAGKTARLIVLVLLGGAMLAVGLRWAWRP
jgi:signal peptidase